MKHPAAQQPARPGIPSNIPWSPKGELFLRENIKIYWAGMWIALGSFLIALIIAIVDRSLTEIAISFLFFVLAVWNLYKLNHDRELLGREMGRGANGEFFEGSGMLANKPRDTSRLTRWIQHVSFESTSVTAYCECGYKFTYRDMLWIKNGDDAFTACGVDPHGGRYVLICQCGIGHFRFKG